MAHTIRQRDTARLITAGDEDNGTMIVLEGCWYFDPEVVDMTHLTVTERTYTCPYKGVCYWIDLDSPALQARNIGFVYHHPLAEYQNIAGRIAFYGRDTSGTIAAMDEGEPV